jgi:hypothetical protein
MNEAEKDKVRKESDEVTGRNDTIQGEHKMMKIDRRRIQAKGTTEIIANHKFDSGDCKRFLSSDLPGGRSSISKDTLQSTTKHQRVFNSVFAWDEKIPLENDVYKLDRGEAGAIFSSGSTKGDKYDVLHSPSANAEKAEKMVPSNQAPTQVRAQKRRKLSPQPKATASAALVAFFKPAKPTSSAKPSLDTITDPKKTKGQVYKGVNLGRHTRPTAKRRHWSL